MIDDHGMRPPFGQPPGPREGNPAVIAAFVRGERSGHSHRFYAEGPLLLADGDQTIAIRVEPGTVLVRVDLTDDLAGDRRAAETGLAAAGLRMLDEDTLWGVPVALQLAGLRLSSWDLWGADLETAFAAVRRTAVGDGDANGATS
ncbi:MAG: hypothetical protein M3527_01385 [Actinomycetota bacterium]|nr:hypothetical protein [Acidimicrobiia bacterium]MDQ3293094.1 hypothetical protein [Actinomycetota bacterium]